MSDPSHNQPFDTSVARYVDRGERYDLKTRRLDVVSVSVARVTTRHGEAGA